MNAFIRYLIEDRRPMNQGCPLATTSEEFLQNNPRAKEVQKSNDPLYFYPLSSKTLQIREAKEFER